MANENLVYIETFTAAADQSAKTGYLVELTTTANQVSVANGAGDKVVGVIVNGGSAAGDATTVAVLGRARCIAGDTVTAGDSISTMNNGKADLATTGQYSIGRALSSAAADEYFEILLHGPIYIP
jgi:hypothetical protein